MEAYYYFNIFTAIFIAIYIRAFIKKKSTVVQTFKHQIQRRFIIILIIQILFQANQNRCFFYWVYRQTGNHRLH